MFPSGSTRPDQPTANVSNLPASAAFSEETNSVGVELDVEADLLLHRLDHLAEPGRDRIGAEHQAGP